MPTDPKRIEHALALAADGRTGEAEALLAQLAGADRDATAAWHLAWLRLRGGDADGALAILSEFADDPLCNERLREQLLGERRNAEAAAAMARAPGPAGEPRSLVAAAIARHLARDFAGAVDLCRQALAVAPAHAPAHNHLGRALHNLGQVPGALSAFEAAVRANPDYPEAWHNLGHALRARGELEPACQAFEQALRISPGYRSARLNLGITRFSLDQPGPALACFDALLARDGDDVEAMVNAGLCLQLRGDLGQARARYERALSLAPENQSAWYYLGVLLNEQSEPAEAVRALRRALALRPDDADAWAELAGVHELSSELDQAGDAVKSGLQHAPGHPLLNIEAARLERRRGDLLGAEARLRRLDPQRMPARVRQQYFYELGNVLDRNQQNDAAFRAFEQGNALAARSVRREAVDGEAFFREVAQVADWLDAGAPGIEAGAGDGGDTGADLCFLVGFPRSGTTLLDTILDAHPGVRSVEEKPTLEPVVHALRALPGGYPSALAGLDAGERDRLRRLYRAALAHHGAGDGTLVLDKLPLRTVHAGLVQALFPKARLLFSLRHPCDVVLSNFMQQYAVNEAFVNFYTLADTVRTYDAVFGLWEKLRARLSLPVGYVRYENLVEAPGAEAEAACRFLGIAWDPATLEADQRNRERGRIRTNSYQQVAEPIYRRALGRWQRYRGQLQPYLPTLAPHAARWGYSLD
ncbi:tetratricopeptide repeat-containing sulfotransferase family protein [Arenimonas caeni]|jgi:Tfp pilus assembly protein PilF|nr:tetratricopeptide repeat-containing sulfotransferase family protein [Arenimonas caeni]MDY0021945.1 sulfotransferase [Arenimonas caeni]